ncbi:MAG: BatA domain-containing protein [Planctomycetota bacterium]|jgi:hypothetical protein
MQFGQPQGLWLGAAAALVLLTYLVRRRARRVEVPFLALWTGALSERRGGFGGALTRWLDLLLAVLACAAVALAAGGPFLPGEVSTVRDLVLVLDGGVEMRAAGRRDRLVRIAEAEINRRARGARLVCVRVDADGPRLFVGSARADARAFVRAHEGGWQRAPFEPALALAREGARSLHEPDLVFCTYRPARPEGFRLRTVREAAPNGGLVGLEVVGDPEGGGRLARVRVEANGAVEIEGLWRGEVDGAKDLDFPLPASGDVTFRLRKQGDAFAPDDALYLTLPERKRPRVLVVAEGEPSPFLISAMRALEETRAIRGPLDKTVPARVAEVVETYDVVIFDRCAPTGAVAGMRALYLGPQGGTLPFQLGPATDAPALFDVKDDHVVLRGTGLGRLPPVKARAVRGGEALASAAPGPVVVAGPGWIALGYDPEGCVLASSPAYPLFLRNCIAQLAGGAPVRQAEFVRIGERTQLSGLAEDPTGRRRRLGTRWDGPPGFWTQEQTRFAVNFLEAGLDLEAASEPSDPVRPVGVPAIPDHPLTPLFAAAAFVFMLAGWWWFWR